MDKSGEMGIGTLIIFIASLVVSVIAAVVLIQASGNMQEKSYTTSDQAKRIVGTVADIIEVSGTDGSKTNLTDFQIMLKISAGSDEIKFSQAVISVSSHDFMSTLTYAGEGATNENEFQGYFTNKAEEIGEISIWAGNYFDSGLWFIGNGAWLSIGFDLDEDGRNDSVMTCGIVAGTPCPYPYNGTSLRFNLTSLGPAGGIVYAPLEEDDGSLATLYTGAAGAFSISHADIGSYGFIQARRTNANNQNQISSFDTGIRFNVFKNPYPLGSDMDDDTLADYFAINRTHALFILSSLDDPIGISLGTRLNGPKTLSVQEDIIHAGNTYGSLSISGTTTAADRIDGSAVITVTPATVGMGTFSVMYLESGTNHIDGNLQRGDIARIYFETPRGMVGQDNMRIHFIPKTGSPTVVEYNIPDVISKERHFLYP